MAGERTEKASPRRRQKAREQGDILHSRELTAAAGTLAGVMTLGVVGSRIAVGWRATLADFLDLGGAAHWEADNLARTIATLCRISVSALAPVAIVMLAVAAAALLAAILQTGGVSFHTSALAFRLDRINPLSNAKSLFSVRAAGRLGKSLLPAAILGFLAAGRILRQMHLPPFSTARLRELGTDAFSLVQATAWLLFAWSAVDYLLEWQGRESRLRMSKQEQREEMKETEGSPQIRGRIRSLQRQMRRQRVKADVSRAAVVVTNPTHYAVALGFDFATMEAPRVLAKGRNLLAEEIKAEARWAGVPIVENPPLARSLYRGVEVGSSIPADLYATVAAILAYLYRQRVEAEVRERCAREAAARTRNTAPPRSPGGAS